MASAGTQGGQLDKETLEPRNQVVVRARLGLAQSKAAMFAHEVFVSWKARN